jgi:hypothetical protein
MIEQRLRVLCIVLLQTYADAEYLESVQIDAVVGRCSDSTLFGALGYRETVLLFHFKSVRKRTD